MALKNRLTYKRVRDIITDDAIFTKYFGEFDLSRGYNSVFREDDRASTGFYRRENGTLIYNDFANGTKCNAIEFVMKLFKLDFHKATEKIASDFNIKTSELKSNEELVEVKPVSKSKNIKRISVFKTKFTKEHINYWEQYGITLEELNENNIIAVDKVIINTYNQNNKLINSTTSPNNGDIKFAYFFNEGVNVYIKVYTPYNHDFKWVGNVPLRTPFGLETLTKCKDDNIIITKSVKDAIVLRKFFKNVVALQNESSASISHELMKSFVEDYKQVYIWFDYDRTGIKATNYFVNKYKAKSLFTICNNKSIWKNLTSVKEREIKDPSDFIKRYGLRVFSEYINHLIKNNYYEH